MEILSRIDLPKLLMHFNLPLIGVEIGVAGASNATDLLKAGLEKIYCVDAWETIDVPGDGSYPDSFHKSNYKLALKNLSQFDSVRYTLLKGRSSEMCKEIPDNSLGLVYIDGDHSFNGCMADMENYYPKLVSGGIMSLHDFYNLGYGVMEAAIQFAAKHNTTIYTIPENHRNNASVWFQNKI